MNSELKKIPKDWTVDDVELFVKSIGYPDHASWFQEQEVDGVSLLLLKRSDVVNGMAMKMGPALKIYGHIQRLQTITPGVQSENVATEPDEVGVECNVSALEELTVPTDQVEPITVAENGCTESVIDSQTLKNGDLSL